MNDHGAIFAPAQGEPWKAKVWRDSHGACASIRRFPAAKAHKFRFAHRVYRWTLNDHVSKLSRLLSASVTYRIHLKSIESLLARCRPILFLP